MDKIYVVMYDNGSDYEDHMVFNEFACLDRESAELFVDHKNRVIDSENEQYEQLRTEYETNCPLFEKQGFDTAGFRLPRRIREEEYFKGERYNIYCELKFVAQLYPNRHYTFEELETLVPRKEILADPKKVNGLKSIINMFYGRGAFVEAATDTPPICKDRYFIKCSHCVFDGGQLKEYSKCCKCSSNPNMRDFFQAADPASEELYKTLTKEDK